MHLQAIEEDVIIIKSRKVVHTQCMNFADVVINSTTSEYINGHIALDHLAAIVQ